MARVLSRICAGLVIISLIFGTASWLKPLRAVPRATSGDLQSRRSLPFTTVGTVAPAFREAASAELVLPPPPPPPPPAQPQPVTNKWRAPIVIVPAVLHEFDLSRPPWAVAPPDNMEVYLYQRTDPKAPRYAPESGDASGAYLQFVVEHYDHLPDFTAFVHAMPEDHNKDWLDWLRCLRLDEHHRNGTAGDKLVYAPLNRLFVCGRSLDLWAAFPPMGIAPWMEQCWHDMLRAFDFDPKSVFPRGQKPVVNFYCCFQVVVSRAQILTRSREQYERALRIVSRSTNVCHEGPLNLSELYSASKEANYPPQRLDLEKSEAGTASGTFEHLQHFLLGGQPVLMQPLPPSTWCEHFQPDLQCPDSPCRADGRGPHNALGCDKPPILSHKNNKGKKGRRRR